MRQTDCLPGVSEKFVILRRFTRIMKPKYYLELSVLLKESISRACDYARKENA